IRQTCGEELCKKAQEKHVKELGMICILLYMACMISLFISSD
ncbi:unnamed protein product, partial [Heterotrigona itama]